MYRCTCFYEALREWLFPQDFQKTVDTLSKALKISNYPLDTSAV